jgi:integrase
LVHVGAFQSEPWSERERKRIWHSINAVWVPLPKNVLAALKEISEEGRSHYFYSGIGKAKTAITEWQARLKNVYTIAGITDDGYKSHRLRDTFSVNLLEKG